MTIESILAPASARVAIDAIYYVARLIRHRVGLAVSMPRLLARGSQGEPNPEAIRLAESIVRAIEAETNSPLGDISPKVATDIIGKLERLATERFSEGVPVDANRGEALLQELRESRTL